MAMLDKRSLRWFFAAGCIGLTVAVVLFILRPANPEIILLFWPPAIAGIADPTGFFDKLLTAAVMFGGNFVLYGLLGAVAGVAADRLHR